MWRTVRINNNTPGGMVVTLRGSSPTRSAWCIQERIIAEVSQGLRELRAREEEETRAAQGKQRRYRAPKGAIQLERELAFKKRVSTASVATQTEEEAVTERATPRLCVLCIHRRMLWCPHAGGGVPLRRPQGPPRRMTPSEADEVIALLGSLQESAEQLVRSRKIYRRRLHLYCGDDRTGLSTKGFYI
ncbi:hypothetical protein KPH14_012720 [Odynerus spinipes]|uniref:Uncharacterized protein n=1 Tax=Odynerus spinipes TaxID=1348599 RepID=A0AAD9RHC9_9HYME|nr:hypothetical protein KPH14_012720 [Odynerus spinipes]